MKFYLIAYKTGPYAKHERFGPYDTLEAARKAAGNLHHLKQGWGIRITRTTNS